MRDQNVSKTPLNEFLLPDESPGMKGTPKRVHIEEKSDPTQVFVEKVYPSQENAHPESRVLNKIMKVPFSCERQSQKYPFLSKILFLTPLTRLGKKYRFTRFFGHACVHCYI